MSRGRFGLLAIALGAILTMTDPVAALPLPQSCNTGSEPERIRIAEVDDFGAITDDRGGMLRQADIVFALNKPRPAISYEDMLFLSLPLEPDRWERRLGHLVDVETGAWLAADWVLAGAAFVAPAKTSLSCLAPLLQAEEEARLGRRGLWAEDRIFAANDPALVERAGRFTLVEGVVRSVGRTRRTHFLNFGGNWSRDFTATIDVGEESAFDAAGIDIVALAGKRVRLRGFLTLNGGPALAIDHPAQLERLPAAGGFRRDWKRH